MALDVAGMQRREEFRSRNLLPKHGPKNLFTSLTWLAGIHSTVAFRPNWHFCSRSSHCIGY